jgi:hypothetical protein
MRRTAGLRPGPERPVSGIAGAAATDTDGTTTHTGVAAVRSHPAASLFLTALLASVIVCYVLFVSVSVRLIPVPPAESKLPGVGGKAEGHDRDLRDGTIRIGGQQVGGARSAATPAGGLGAGPGPSQLATSPVRLASPTPAPSASPSPSPTGASPSPSPPGGDPGGLCLDVGSLGVCLSTRG